MKKCVLLLILIFSIFMIGCGEKKPPVDNPLDKPPVDKPEEKPDNNQEEKPQYTEEELIAQKDLIFDWLLEKYNEIEIDGDMSFPKKHPDYELVINFLSFDEEYLSDEGKYTAPILDYETEILFTIKVGKVEYELFIPVIFKGYGDSFDLVYYCIEKYIPNTLSSSIRLPETFSECPCHITWSSLDEDIITSTGTITKDFNQDKTTILTASITCGGVTKEYSKAVTVLRVSDSEKAGLASDWLKEKYSDLSIITNDIELVSSENKYGSKIVWTTSNPNTISSKGVFKCPLIDEVVTLTANIFVGLRVATVSFNVTAKGIDEVDMWKKIECFLDRINVKEINNQQFYLYGCEEGYERVPSQNLGYLPFYNAKDPIIKVDLLPSDSPLCPHTKRKDTHWIVVHNTGMAHPSATAEGLNEYIHSTDRVASWHFSVDDKEIYQHLPIDEVGWHAGDGSSTYLKPGSGGIGGGNQNGIGIENCVYEGVDFNKVMRNLAKLVSNLLIQYDLGLENVKQHWDFSGKDCPQVIRHAGRWNELLDLISLELFAKTQLEGVSFEFESLNPEIMDNEGTIIKHPGVETEISYEVRVTYNGEVKKYTYKSTLLALK